jgi:DNA-binding NtrC family response regulator
LSAFGDDLTIDEAELFPIGAVLKRYEGNKTQAAAILGVERKSLYRKVKRLGIDFDEEGDGC